MSDNPSLTEDTLDTIAPTILYTLGTHKLHLFALRWIFQLIYVMIRNMFLHKLGKYSKILIYTWWQLCILNINTNKEETYTSKSLSKSITVWTSTFQSCGISNLQYAFNVFQWNSIVQCSLILNLTLDIHWCLKKTLKSLVLPLN